MLYTSPGFYLNFRHPSVNVLWLWAPLVSSIFFLFQFVYFFSLRHFHMLHLVSSPMGWKLRVKQRQSRRVTQPTHRHTNKEVLTACDKGRVSSKRALCIFPLMPSLMHGTVFMWLRDLPCHAKTTKITIFTTLFPLIVQSPLFSGFSSHCLNTCTLGLLVTLNYPQVWMRVCGCLSLRVGLGSMSARFGFSNPVIYSSQ